MPCQYLDWLWNGKLFLRLPLTSDVFWWKESQTGPFGSSVVLWKSGLRVCCWWMEHLGATKVHVPTKLPSHSSWPRRQGVSCKAGCCACKGMGEKFEWTLIRNKFEDPQYLSSGRRCTLLGNTSSLSCSDEGQIREKRNSSIQTAALLLQCTAKNKNLVLVQAEASQAKLDFIITFHLFSWHCLVPVRLLDNPFFFSFCCVFFHPLTFI